jgi:hypothetical protein
MSNKLHLHMYVWIISSQRFSISPRTGSMWLNISPRLLKCDKVNDATNRCQMMTKAMDDTALPWKLRDWTTRTTLKIIGRTTQGTTQHYPENSRDWTTRTTLKMIGRTTQWSTQATNVIIWLDFSNSQLPIHRYTHSMFVISIWLTVTKSVFSNANGFFSPLRRFSSITDKSFTEVL